MTSQHKPLYDYDLLKIQILSEEFTALFLSIKEFKAFRNATSAFHQWWFVTSKGQALFQGWCRHTGITLLEMNACQVLGKEGSSGCPFISYPPGGNSFSLVPDVWKPPESFTAHFKSPKMPSHTQTNSPFSAAVLPSGRYKGAKAHQKLQECHAEHRKTPESPLRWASLFFRELFSPTWSMVCKIWKL